MPSDLSQEEVLRYSRHLTLPDVGLEGQRKLKAAAVLVVGSGGLGSPISLYLTAAGVGHIGIVDYDVLDLTNLQRQILYSTSDVGMPKAEIARRRLLELNPHVQVDAYPIALTSENIEAIAKDYDILVDGTDNFPTRYLLNDYAVLCGKPYVYGSIFRFEGQMSVFDARRGPCYRCLFPEAPSPSFALSCSEGGVMGVLPGTIGTLQASEVIKLILGIGEPMIGKLLLYDALESAFQIVQLRKNPTCVACSEHPTLTHLMDDKQFYGSSLQQPDESALQSWEIEPRQLAERLKRAENIYLLDIREAGEQQVSRLPGARHIPYGQLSARLNELPKEAEIVVFCRDGSRSRDALQLLHQEGFTQAKSLRGGINAWAREVDASMLQY